MPTTVACKLPHGLTVTHMGRTININGNNASFNPLMPAPNGGVGDDPIMSAGYGLTMLSDEDAETFADWCDKAQYKDGVKAHGYLDEPFLPLRNGSIILTKSEAEARKETKAISGDVVTGLDGLDGDAEIKKAAASVPDLANTGKAGK